MDINRLALVSAVLGLALCAVSMMCGAIYADIDSEKLALGLIGMFVGFVHMIASAAIASGSVEYCDGGCRGIQMPGYEYHF